MMASRRRTKPDATSADSVLLQAEALVLLWERAEDWVVPRVPPSQLRVLTVLDRGGPMNLSALAHELGAIPSSASRLCDRLAAAGLLHREVSAGSRREVTLTISRQGRARLEAFAAVRRADFANVLELMSPAARANLVDGLTEFGYAVTEVLETSAREA